MLVIDMIWSGILLLIIFKVMIFKNPFDIEFDCKKIFLYPNNCLKNK